MRIQIARDISAGMVGKAVLQTHTHTHIHAHMHAHTRYELWGREWLKGHWCVQMNSVFFNRK